MNKELIVKFFQKKCSEEEAEKVAAYLKNNPAILDQYLGKGEWDQEIDADVRPDEFWDDIWKGIKPQKTRRLPVIKYAIAASLIGLILTIGLMYVQYNHEKIKTEVVSSSFKMRTIENKGLSIKALALNDGSHVSLLPNSSITFSEPFLPNKRDIHLDGEATFKVAKDTARPFTVHSGQISTTALGTEFKVAAIKNNSNIIVQLFHGKVVVRSRSSVAKETDKASYLLPGDQLTFNRENNMVSIQRYKKDRDKNEYENENTAKDMLVFEKEPLPDVFDQLALKYKVNIRYSNSELEHLYYIGSWNERDSVHRILLTITRLNGLKLNRDSDGVYTITK